MNRVSRSPAVTRIGHPRRLQAVHGRTARPGLERLSTCQDEADSYADAAARQGPGRPSSRCSRSVPRWPSSASSVVSATWRPSPPIRRESTSSSRLSRERPRPSTPPTGPGWASSRATCCVPRCRRPTCPSRCATRPSPSRTAASTSTRASMPEVSCVPQLRTPPAARPSRAAPPSRCSSCATSTAATVSARSSARSARPSWPPSSSRATRARKASGGSSPSTSTTFPTARSAARPLSASSRRHASSSASRQSG